MSKTFIDNHGREISSLEQETADDLAEILDRPVKYEATLIDPSDPQHDVEKCKIIIEYSFSKQNRQTEDKA